MAVIGITYEVPSPTKYKSVYICYDNGMKKEKVFDSGNFVKDWYDLQRFVILELAGKEHGFSFSSSVDNFIIDGAPFDSAYLKFDDNDEPYFDYKYDIKNEGIEFFVPKGTQPTWGELKEMCE